MPRKAGFTRKDYNKFKNFRAQGYTAQEIAGALNICQANVEAALDDLGKRTTGQAKTPAQKAAATRKLNRERSEAEAEETEDKNLNFM